MDRHPDIIIFNPDQMRADALRHLGNPASVTPNLDRFQQTDAVSFRNAFCQNPVCVPSRCSFATGLYPHVYGHRTMAHLLRSHESSIFSELKDAGYDVWMNARNDLIAGQIKGLCERHASEIFTGEKCRLLPDLFGKIQGESVETKTFIPSIGVSSRWTKTGKITLLMMKRSMLPRSISVLPTRSSRCVFFSD